MRFFGDATLSFPRIVLGSFLTFLAMSFIAGPLAANSEPPGAEHARAVVQKASDELRTLVETSDLTTKAERVDRVATVLNDTFDLMKVGASIVGPENYNKWTDEQRGTYVDAFIRYMVATNDSNIRLFQSERFEIVDTEAGPRGLIIVHTRYGLEDGKWAKIDFVVGQNGDEWLIVDVHEDAAISLLAVKRAELNSVLKRKGFDGLITLMNKITAKLTAD